MKNIRIIAIIFSFFFVNQGYANQCLKAINLMADKTIVPLNLLLQVAKVESGYGAHKIPWPWAIQVQGKSYYFKTQSAAYLYIKHLLSLGIENFDVGCFQINWRWHKDKIRTPQELLNPLNNTLIAAQFLIDLKTRHASWMKAVSNYHSSNPQQGKNYAKLVFKS